LYNDRRLHQALGYRAPMAVWRERMQAAKAVDMMDNADALTTCPSPSPSSLSDLAGLGRIFALIRPFFLTGWHAFAQFPHD
jgi:hypothetical protein